MGHRKMAAYGEREHNGRYALEDYEYSRNHTKAETIKRWKRNLKKKARRIARVKFSKRCRPAERRDEMAYSDVQQTEFNRATENLIEITWTYVNLQKEFPKLSETDSMGWKQMFVVWANEFEENYGRTDWDESEKTYQEAIEEFAKEKIFQWVGIRKYICIGRHIEGITLNPYEWLMEKGRKVKLFENEVEAKAYLITNGYTDEEMEFLKFEEVWC